jgi:hypothetical protein
MKIIPITQFGEFTDIFLNIRSHLYDEEGVFDLFVRKVLPSALAVEEATLLRLRFSWLLGVAVDYDIDVDLFGGLGKTWEPAPRLPGRNEMYPLLEITDSPWKAQLPEWRARDNPDVRHIRMIGNITSFDVLGELESGEWIENPHSEFSER